MKIAIASDHRGFEAKRKLIDLIENLGHEAVDFGTNDEESVDYPDFGSKVAQSIVDGSVNRGVLICGTGIGMAIVANKFAGVRAAACHDDLTAKLSRLHNDANVICLSADLLGERLLNRIVETWLTTDFEGGRHQRRLQKIAAIETEQGCGSSS